MNTPNIKLPFEACKLNNLHFPKVPELVITWSPTFPDWWIINYCCSGHCARVSPEVVWKAVSFPGKSLGCPGKMDPSAAVIHGARGSWRWHPAASRSIICLWTTSRPWMMTRLVGSTGPCFRLPEHHPWNAPCRLERHWLDGNYWIGTSNCWITSRLVTWLWVVVGNLEFREIPHSSAGTGVSFLWGMAVVLFLKPWQRHF